MNNQILIDRAREVLGNKDDSMEWLQRPNRALNDVAPLSYAATEPGFQEVLDLLGRIEHGVYS